MKKTLWLVAAINSLIAVPIAAHAEEAFFDALSDGKVSVSI